MPSTSSAKIAPIMPNCSRFSGRDSALAPASISTQGWSRAGSGTAMPGRCTPFTRPIVSSDAASMAPVEPAEIAPAARPSRTIRQAVTIDDPGLARTAAAGSSS